MPSLALKTESVPWGYRHKLRSLQGSIHWIEQQLLEEAAYLRLGALQPPLLQEIWMLQECSSYRQ